MRNDCNKLKKETRERIKTLGEKVNYNYLEIISVDSIKLIEIKDEKSENISEGQRYILLETKL